MNKSTKAAFIRDLCNNDSKWVYACWHHINVLTLDGFNEHMHNVLPQCDMNNFDKRTYRNTSGNRAVCNENGSILDLGKGDTVYATDWGYIIETEFSRWGYVRVC